MKFTMILHWADHLLLLNRDKLQLQINILKIHHTFVKFNKIRCESEILNLKNFRNNICDISPFSPIQAVPGVFEFFQDPSQNSGV